MAPPWGRPHRSSRCLPPFPPLAPSPVASTARLARSATAAAPSLFWAAPRPLSAQHNLSFASPRSPSSYSNRVSSRSSSLQAGNADTLSGAASPAPGPGRHHCGQAPWAGVSEGAGRAGRGEGEAAPQAGNALRVFQRCQTGPRRHPDVRAVLLLCMHARRPWGGGGTSPPASPAAVRHRSACSSPRPHVLTIRATAHTLPRRQERLRGRIRGRGHRVAGLAGVWQPEQRRRRAARAHAGRGLRGAGGECIHEGGRGGDWPALLLLVRGDAVSSMPAAGRHSSCRHAGPCVTSSRRPGVFAPFSSLPL